MPMNAQKAEDILRRAKKQSWNEGELIAALEWAIAQIERLTKERGNTLIPPTNDEMSEAWGRMADGRARWNGEDLRAVSEFLRHRRYKLNRPTPPAPAGE